MGTVVKAKVCDLEGELREVFLRRSRKDFTGVVQGVSGKKRFLVRFHNVFENDITSNQPTIVVVEKIPVTEESEVPRISEKPNETVLSDKGCYSVCVLCF